MGLGTEILAGFLIATSQTNKVREQKRTSLDSPVSGRRTRQVGQCRTIGPAEKETAVEGGPAADHRRLARRPVLNDSIQLIGPGSLVGNSRETFHQSGTDGSNPVPSSRQSFSR
jgi:hypothetical protein